MLVCVQPTISDGRLAPVLAQQWGRGLVLWASPEEQTGEMISGNSLVGTHLMTATLRCQPTFRSSTIQAFKCGTLHIYIFTSITIIFRLLCTFCDLRHLYPFLRSPSQSLHHPS